MVERFSTAAPIPSAKGDDRFTKLKEQVNLQMTMQKAYPSDWFSRACEVSSEVTVTAAKPTEGLYRRLKKEFIDVDELVRKNLTGGKVDRDKLE